MLWTDGKGDQKEFSKAVKRWKAFHANLLDGSSNKIATLNEGIVLQSHLYGRARDLCKSISDDVINRMNDADVVVAAIYKRDTPTVMSNVYGELIFLMTMKRNNNESYRVFDSRFNAQPAHFNSLATDASLPDSTSALMLLVNAAVDSSRCVSILAADGLSSDIVNPNSSTDDMLNLVQYESAATILRQCDHQPIHDASVRTTSSSSANVSNASDKSSKRQPNKRTNKMTREKAANAKTLYTCKRYGKFGLWYGAHIEDCSLPKDMSSLDLPIRSDNNHNQTKPQQDDTSEKGNRVVKFNNAVVHHLPLTLLHSTAYTGSLVDSGAPY